HYQGLKMLTLHSQAKSLCLGSEKFCGTLMWTIWKKTKLCQSGCYSKDEGDMQFDHR
ncbi:hypothetical protein GOP47_0002701, partial [Adiantum capillus-veneris]